MKKAFIYILAVFCVLSSLLILVAAYMYSSPFVFAESGTSGENYEKIAEGGKILRNMDTAGFNSFVTEFFKDSGNSEILREGLSVDGIACVIGDSLDATGNTNSAYINIYDDWLDIPFSFKLNWGLELNDGNARLSFSDIRLGANEIPYLGLFLWRMLGIPENVAFPVKNTGEIMYLSAVEANEEGILTLTYDYDKPALAEVFNTILSDTEARKIEFHREKDDVDEDIMRIAEAAAVTGDEASGLIESFEEAPDSFLSLCFLLDKDGIRNLYSHFGEYYYKHSSAEKLIEASENEIDSDLNEFNRLFSHLLLQYLYRNPDYSVNDGKLYLNGREITPDDVLSGVDGVIYDVAIMEEDSAIVVQYGLSGNEVRRVVLKGAEAQ